MRFTKVIFIFLVTFGLSAAFSVAQSASVEEDFIRCKATFPDAAQAEARLSCFDSIEVTQANADETLAGEDTAYSENCKNAAGKSCRYLDRKWRLSSGESRGWTDLETHRLNYLTVTHSSNPNQRPSSPSNATTASRGLDDDDLKFQISFKTELLRSIPWIRELPRVETSRLWAAYTQQSYWQVFDSGNSRPMREHNFAPELILSLGLDNKLDGERKPYLPRMANLGAIHESNGRSQPFSRSWNRIYLESAFELSENLTMSVRPWWRIPEASDKDDNSDIAKYLGYGDVLFHWDSIFSNFAANLLLRDNLRSDNKGFAKLDLQYQPLERDNVKLHLMLSNGYGESLVDYNHAQTVFGLGVSIGE